MLSDINEGLNNLLYRGSHDEKWILTPPPNVTGRFHLGHFLTLNLSFFLQEALVRMGYRVKTVTGWDHAGIASETKVNPDRSLDRDRVVSNLIAISDVRISEFKRQLKDWGIHFRGPKPEFTLGDSFYSETLSNYLNLKSRGTIRESDSFVNLGVLTGNIYSDNEVERVQCPKPSFFVRYRGSDGDLFVSTTQPETIHSDVALCVNPRDSRYTHLIGRTFIVPVSGSRIGLFTSEDVDMASGTGVLKLTPDYDRRDFDICRRLNITISRKFINRDLTLNIPGWKDVPYPLIWRRTILELIRGGNLLGFRLIDGSYIRRKGNTAERILSFNSRQEVIDLGELSDRFSNLTLANTNIIPRWSLGDVSSWISRMDRWPITRRMHWGVRISEDSVLDTWFNASLWPLKGLKYSRHCFDYLITGWDLTYFWFWRMSLMSYCISGRNAFRNVFLHGLIVDGKGSKMSKSVGNVIDPKELIDLKGIDYMRLISLKNSGMHKKIHLDINDRKVERLLSKVANIDALLTGGVKFRAEPEPGISLLLCNYLVRYLRDYYGAFLSLRLGDVFDIVFNSINDISLRLIPMIEGLYEGSRDDARTLLLIVFRSIVRSFSFLIPNTWGSLRRLNLKIDFKMPLISHPYVDLNVFKINVLLRILCLSDSYRVEDTYCRETKGGILLLSNKGYINIRGFKF